MKEQAAGWRVRIERSVKSNQRHAESLEVRRYALLRPSALVVALDRATKSRTTIDESRSSTPVQSNRLDGSPQ